MRYRNIENTPLFPFGFGLHYTPFAVENVESTASVSVRTLHAGEAAVVRCTVRNTGDRAGYATMQLYLQGLSGSIVRRVRELKGFEKLFLEPGEQKSVELKLTLDELGVWNRAMHFDAEPSTVRLYLAESGRPVWDGELRITAE